MFPGPDVIILSLSLLISTVVFVLNQFRKTCQQTFHFAILSFLFFSFNVKFGSFFNYLRKYRIRDYVSGFPALTLM